MAEILVVGGGLAGLLSVETLVDMGLSVVGLESSDHLGGRVESGHHRVLTETARVQLAQLLGRDAVQEVSEPPTLREKGEWAKLEAPAELPEPERFYLTDRFWVATRAYGELLHKLREKIAPHYELRKLVTEIHGEEKRVVCEDGSQHTYEKLVWCAPLRVLRSVWKGDKSALRALAKLPDGQGGISLEMTLKEPLFSSTNTVVLPFRFKEWKLRALAFHETDSPCSVQWILFLDPEILEDREEVAKCVRTLKREIGKEFPLVNEALVREKITFLPRISGEAPLAWSSFELAPGIAYFGPEVRPETEQDSARNLDLTLSNYPHWRQTLAGWKQSAPI